MSPTLITALASISGLIGFLAVVAYFVFKIRLSEIEISQRSVKRIVEGEGLFNADQILEILKTFKNDATRLEALKELARLSDAAAARVYEKIKSKVDVQHLDDSRAKANLRLSAGVGVVFLIVCSMGLIYATSGARKDVIPSPPIANPSPTPTATPTPTSTPTATPSPTPSEQIVMSNGHELPPLPMASVKGNPQNSLGSFALMAGEAQYEVDNSGGQVRIVLVGWCKVEEVKSDGSPSGDDSTWFNNFSQTIREYPAGTQVEARNIGFHVKDTIHVIEKIENPEPDVKAYENPTVGMSANGVITRWEFRLRDRQFVLRAGEFRVFVKPPVGH